MSEEAKSYADLVGDVFANARTLLNAEARLLRAEILAKGADFIAAMLWAACGAVLAVAGVALVLAGIVLVLIHYGFEPFVAAFLVGGVLLVAAAIAIYVVVAKMRSADIVPRRTLEQVRRDGMMLRGNIWNV